MDEIYFAALDRDDADARAAYLDAACGVDTDLRRRIERLLDARSERGGFLESRAPGPPPARGGCPPHEGVGTAVGPYRLLEQIGEGGMGVVYMAEQTQPVRRRVALKVIKPGMDSRQVVARFEAERQALALMDHPNIARVLDAGATESGLPYFVMELVRGVPITEYCDRHRLSVDERLDLFATVCQAVEHAHQQGVIHRDIKPSNVLITHQDGAPVPKVIDFGVAKAIGQSLTEKTLFTGFTQLIGTPLYMSPEQAELSGVELDTRSDVYPLGVLLYELLTGTTPFDQDALCRAAFDEVRRIIREQEPPKPSTRLSSLGVALRTVSANRQTDDRKLNRSVRGELDWITMKAMEKDRRRRYQTAAAFAADVRRYRANQPVEAGPPSAWYRGRKFVRRNRAALTAVATALTVATVAAGFWAWSAERLRLVQNESRRQEGETRRHRYVADLCQANQFVQSGQGRRALELLQKYRPAPDARDAQAFTWHYLTRLCQVERLTLRHQKGAVYHADFSADGRAVVSCGQDGTARVWDTTTGRLLSTISTGAGTGDVNWASFSPDGLTLATANDDGTVRTWDVRTGTLQTVIHAHKPIAVSVEFTPDGRRLVTAGRDDFTIRLFEIATAREIAAARASEASLECLAVSPDGATLASASSDGRTALWNLADLHPITSGVLRPGHPNLAVAFSADGSRLVTAHGDGAVVVSEVPGLKRVHELNGFGPAPDAQSAAFGVGGATIFSGGGTGILSRRDTATGLRLGSLVGHTEKIWGVSASPDGKSIASASADGTVKLWTADAPHTERACTPYLPCSRTTVFTPDGLTLVLANLVGGTASESTDEKPSVRVDADLEVCGFDAKTGARRFRRVLRRGMRANHAGLTFDGAVAYFCSNAGDPLTAWDVGTGTRLVTLDGIRFATSFHHQYLLIRPEPAGAFESLDPFTGRVRRLSGTEAMTFLTSSVKGDLLALQDRGDLVLWDVAANRVNLRRQDERPKRTAAAFSPDGSVLAIGDLGGDIQLWKVSTLERLGTLAGHARVVGDLSFSPGGEGLLSNSIDRSINPWEVKLWDVATRAELLTLQEPTGNGILRPRFAPDGRTLFFLRGDTNWSKLCFLSAPPTLTVDSEENP